MGMFAKIFAVLNVIMAGVLVGMVSVYVANVGDVQNELATATNRVKALETTIAQHNVEKLEAVQLANTERERLSVEIERLQSENRIIAGELNSAKAANVALEAEKAQQALQITGLSGASQANAANEALLYQQVTELSSSNQNKAAKILELDEALTEQTTTAEAYREETRFLKEQIAALEKQNLELARGGSRPAAGKATRETAVVEGPGGIRTGGLEPEFVIRGTVTAVQEVRGTVFIALNVGTNDGVQEGMRFTVFEGENYLGTAFVTIADLNASAAEVTRLNGKIVASRAEVVAGADERN